MPLSLDAASEVFSEALRETVKRYSLLYLIQGLLLIVAGAFAWLFALLYPLVTPTAVIAMLGWLLVVSGIAQGLSLIGARQVPHFWLQLISVAIAVLIGLLLLRDPAQAMMSISLLLIVFFMIEGISKIVFALTIRPFPHWVWLLASGMVG
ncbi:MAG: HdeD family acid-resistance protein, partial [Pseudomonadales bacterium]